MKKILENIKGGLIFGFTALVVIIAGGLIYATLSFPKLETVNKGDTLTAESWNKVVEAINALKEESNTNLSTLNTINTNLNTLSGTVASIATIVLPAPNVDKQVKFGGKYYKVLSETYRWNGAITACSDLGDGRRLPSAGELYYIYSKKASLSGLSLGSNWFWADDFWDGDGETVVVLNTGSGARINSNVTASNYVICLHD